MIDICVDQGGCIETTRPSTYDDPTCVVDGVVHFSVTHMPGAVPRTASQALATAFTPYVLRLAAEGGLCDPARVGGVNVRAGRVAHPAVAAAMN